MSLCILLLGDHRIKKKKKTAAIYIGTLLPPNEFIECYPPDLKMRVQSLKKIKNKFFQNQKFEIKQKPNRCIIENYFLPEFVIKKQKMRTIRLKSTA